MHEIQNTVVSATLLILCERVSSSQIGRMTNPCARPSPGEHWWIANTKSPEHHFQVLRAFARISLFVFGEDLVVNQNVLFGAKWRDDTGQIVLGPCSGMFLVFVG